MERLTYKGQYGGTELVACQTCDQNKCIGCEHTKFAIERLAAYEDTALKPETIRGIVQSIINLESVKGFDHLKRLVDAEAEGRLIIAPAKIVYEPVWDAGPDCDMKCPERFDGEETCEGCIKACPWAHERPWRPGDEIGKTVFLTVPEAEHALLGDENDDTE